MTILNGKLHIIIIDINELWEKENISNKSLDLQLCNMSFYIRW